MAQNNSSNGSLAFKKGLKRLPSALKRSTMKVAELYVYPVKSTKGTSIETTEVLKTGFAYDRCIAIVNDDDKVITGRERPELVQLETAVVDNKLLISAKSGKRTSFELPRHSSSIPIKLFRNKVVGKAFGDAATNWISDFLQGDYRFVYLDDEFNPLLPRRGGMEGEFKAYADSAPVHLISMATLNYLNSKLKSKVGVRNFRPNIVVEGGEPFEEDDWSLLEINGCTFRVQERTGRCIFTTVNPETSLKNSNMQPLSTLAKIRLKMGHRPTFGIGLVPLEEGIVSLSDKVKIRATSLKH